MAFNFFKKKKKKEDKPHYDPTNIQITDLRVGFFVDYDLKTWEVAEEYEYDWGDSEFTFEFQLVAGDDMCFLSIDKEDGLTLVISKKIKLNRLDPELSDRIIKKGKPFKKIKYKGTTYYRENEAVGFYRNTATTKSEKSQEMIAWDYFDDEEKKTITIEQWEDEFFEASIGIVVPEYEFMNITPAGDNIL